MLTIEYVEKFDHDGLYKLYMTEKYIIFMTTTTNANVNPKNMLVQLAWTSPPALAHKLALAATPALPC